MKSSRTLFPFFVWMFLFCLRRTTNLEDAPALMFAVGYTMMLALPDEIFREIISSTNSDSEEKFKRKIHKIKPILQNRFSQFRFSFVNWIQDQMKEKMNTKAINFIQIKMLRNEKCTFLLNEARKIYIAILVLSTFVC